MAEADGAATDDVSRGGKAKGSYGMTSSLRASLRKSVGRSRSRVAACLDSSESHAGSRGCVAGGSGRARAPPTEPIPTSARAGARARAYDRLPARGCAPANRAALDPAGGDDGGDGGGCPPEGGGRPPLSTHSPSASRSDSNSPSSSHSDQSLADAPSSTAGSDRSAAVSHREVSAGQAWDAHVLHAVPPFHLLLYPYKWYSCVF